MDDLLEHPLWWDLVDGIAAYLQEDNPDCDRVYLQDLAEAQLIDMIQEDELNDDYDVIRACKEVGELYGIDFSEECHEELTVEERIANMKEILDRELEARKLK